MTETAQDAYRRGRREALIEAAKLARSHRHEQWSDERVAAVVKEAIAADIETLADLPPGAV